MPLQVLRSTVILLLIVRTQLGLLLLPYQLTLQPPLVLIVVFLIIKYLLVCLRVLQSLVVTLLSLLLCVLIRLIPLRFQIFPLRLYKSKEELIALQILILALKILPRVIVTRCCLVLSQYLRLKALQKQVLLRALALPSQILGRLSLSRLARGQLLVVEGSLSQSMHILPLALAVARLSLFISSIF